MNTHRILHQSVRGCVIGSVLLVAALARANPPPKYDHIIVIFEENQDYGRIIGSKDDALHQPYSAGHVRRRVVYGHVRRAAS